MESNVDLQATDTILIKKEFWKPINAKVNQDKENDTTDDKLEETLGTKNVGYLLNELILLFCNNKRNLDDNLSKREQKRRKKTERQDEEKSKLCRNIALGEVRESHISYISPLIEIYLLILILLRNVLMEKVANILTTLIVTLVPNHLICLINAFSFLMLGIS